MVLVGAHAASDELTNGKALTPMEHAELCSKSSAPHTRSSQRSPEIVSTVSREVSGSAQRRSGSGSQTSTAAGGDGSQGSAARRAGSSANSNQSRWSTRGTAGVYVGDSKDDNDDDDEDDEDVHRSLRHEMTLDSVTYQRTRSSGHTPSVRPSRLAPSLLSSPSEPTQTRRSKVSITVDSQPPPALGSASSRKRSPDLYRHGRIAKSICDLSSTRTVPVIGSEPAGTRVATPKSVKAAAAAAHIQTTPRRTRSRSTDRLLVVPLDKATARHVSSASSPSPSDTGGASATRDHVASSVPQYRRMIFRDGRLVADPQSAEAGRLSEPTSPMTPRSTAGSPTKRLQVPLRQGLCVPLPPGM